MFRKLFDRAPRGGAPACKSSRAPRAGRPGRRRPRLEELESRYAPACVFVGGDTILGDEAADRIELRIAGNLTHVFCNGEFLGSTGQTALFVDGGGGDDDDLLVNDEEYELGDDYTLTDDVLALPPLITEDAAAPLAAIAGTRVNVARLNWTVNILNVPTVALNTAQGGSTVFVQGTAPPKRTVNLGPRNDTVIVGDPANTLNGIRANLCITDRGGFDTLILNDHGHTNPEGYFVGNGLVTRSNLSGQIMHSNVESLVLNAASSTGNNFLEWTTVAGPATVINMGSGNDFGVVWTKPAGSTTVFNGQGGNDAVHLTFAGTMDFIQGAVTFNGGPGQDEFHLNDSNNPSAQTYLITAPSVTRSGLPGPFTHGTVESVVLSGGGAGNNIFVWSTAAGVQTTINSGNGSDSIFLGFFRLLDGIRGLLNINGQAGNDTLDVDDRNSSGVGSLGSEYGITSGIVGVRRFSSGALLALTNYANVENLFVRGGQANDWFRIFSTAVNTTTTATGGPGDDLFWIGTGDPPPGTSTVDLIDGLLNVDGEGGSNRLDVNDQSHPFSPTYTITPTMFIRQTPSKTVRINYFNFAANFHLS